MFIFIIGHDQQLGVSNSSECRNTRGKEYQRGVLLLFLISNQVDSIVSIFQALTPTQRIQNDIKLDQSTYSGTMYKSGFMSQKEGNKTSRRSASGKIHTTSPYSCASTTVCFSFKKMLMITERREAHLLVDRSGHQNVMHLEIAQA